LTLYLDTSVLVSALTNEAETARMQAWLGEQPEGALATSGWVMTEFSSALALKLRSDRIEAVHRADALATLARLVAESLAVLPVSAAQFHTAARFADRHELGLRAGDALHLAICADLGATLCTLDRRLAEGGAALGVGTLLV
jgi:predicted nucleic acid-binding protein